MGVVTSPNYGFNFGSLNLFGTDADITNLGYKFTVQASDDADFGNPVPIEQAVISWLQDGAIVALQGYDNREMYLRVSVDANDGVGLAQGEQALMLETGKTNTLTYKPADSAAAPTVFDVVMSYLELVTDGSYEKSQTRTYGLRIKALPTTRSATLATVTKAAPSGTQTITSIDTCSSTTNWTQTVQVGAGSPATTAAISSGGGTAVAAQAFTLSATAVTRLAINRTSLSASMTSTPYLRVDLSTMLNSANWASGTIDVAFKLNGTAAPVAIQVGTIYWFDASALSITTLTTFEAAGVVIGAGSGGNFQVFVNDLSRSNVLGDQGTGKALTRTLPVAGSARTQGNLAIADASNSLGTVLVYTYPSAPGIIPPPMRPYLTGGTTTADATAVSGSNTTMDFPGLTFDIPVTALQPGGHIIVARVKHASAGARTLNWDASTKQGSTFTSTLDQSGQTAFTSFAGVWQLVTAAPLVLPSVKLGTSGKVSIELTGSTGLLLDDAWVMNIETGHITIVECGTASPSVGGSANRLWLDAPSVATPSPGVYLGFASDRSDSFFAGQTLSNNKGYMSSLGNHEFVPPAMNVFTVTTNSTASSVSLSHYPRYMTHVVV